MITGLKHYTAIKDSGVHWLGDVPEHWSATRLRNAADMRVSNIDKIAKDGELPVRLCNYVDVYKNDRITERLTFMAGTATPDEIRRFTLRIGDVLITKDSETWDDIGVPALVDYEAPDLVSGYHLALLRPRADRLLGAYLLRALQSPARYQFYVEANGVTRYGLSHDAIKSALIPLPPLDEQAAIVRFLDHADRRIRRYVAAKTKLIKLLEEQKQAIIHRAVTRGLDPDVRLKPSGVEWLGDIPEHWRVVRLGRTAKVFNGTTPSRMQPAYWDAGTIPWLASGKVNDYAVRSASEFVTERALRESSISLVPKGAVIIGLVGQGKTRGKSAILEIDACINQNLAAIVPNGLLSGPYLHHFLTAFYKVLREYGRGGNQEALNCEIVGNIRVAVPPLVEQLAICESVSVGLSGVLVTEERIRQEIALLREYRTRLIADVVTGKLDVREVAAGLPDEVDDVDAIEELDVVADDEEMGAEDDVVEEVA